MGDVRVSSRVLSILRFVQGYELRKRLHTTSRRNNGKVNPGHFSPATYYYLRTAVWKYCQKGKWFHYLRSFEDVLRCPHNSRVGLDDYGFFCNKTWIHTHSVTLCSEKTVKA